MKLNDLIFPKNQNVQRITSEDQLIPLLKRVKCYFDYYLITPSYYLLSGRKGMYVIKRKEDFVILCYHPNLRNRIIAFPPQNYNECEILMDVLRCNSALSELQIIRCQNMVRGLLDKLGYTYEFEQHEILDWKYPTALVSTKLISECKGKKFKRLRHDINRINPNKVRIREIREINSELIRELIYSWAVKNRSDNFDLENLMSPYNHLLEKISDKNQGLIGYVMIYDDYLCSLNILAKPVESPGLLSSLAFISDTDIKGSAGYMRYAISNILAKSGINYLFIGGAETLGLYNFKLKQRPIQERELKSIFLFGG